MYTEKLSGKKSTIGALLMIEKINPTKNNDTTYKNNNMVIVLNYLVTFCM